MATLLVSEMMTDIYGWRGAEVDNILRFEHDYPGAKVIRLKPEIIAPQAMFGGGRWLIAHNETRLGKTLYAATEDLGEKGAGFFYWSGEDEARGGD